jgi:(S)-ureidoglycine aminohydrolase
MKDLYGQSRTHIGRRHALIAADGHVKSDVPGISGAETVILINPAMGAGFAQLLVTFETGGTAEMLATDIETVGYFETGGGTVSVGTTNARVAAGGYFFSPAGERWSITSPKRGSRVTLFQKRFVPLEGHRNPQPLIGDANRVPGEPFLGDPDARLQTLLPTHLGFDLAVNIFTYQPGATLPFVETHVMEHGLIMLGGQGVYRLDEAWYTVGAGDVIWMAPFCPQWFAAIGKVPASYLYYKDVNRSALGV